MAGQKRSREQLHFLFKQVMQYLCDADICLILFYGSLLGYIREGGMIDGDDDIDVLMSREDVPKLEQYLSDHPHPSIYLSGRNPEGNLYQLSYYEDASNILGPFDIYVIDEEVGEGKEEKKICVTLEQQRFDIQHIMPCRQVKFLSFDVHIPCEPVKILETVYGKGWKIKVDRKDTIDTIDTIETYTNDTCGTYDSWRSYEILLFPLIIIVLVIFVFCMKNLVSKKKRR